ncbi:MAG TPA: ABC transporter substrate-binding protein [Stellaceae bacterium]|jgi:ABC-type branched-subunit amino acid transport system substrate-binding protein|nr:ABC transporter substrate-binding protein [Stellaceae bacterium]
MNFRTTAAAGLLLALSITPAFAQKNYGPGASDTAVTIGSTGPYSGPVSAASTVTKSFAAYFDKVNAEDGGINGRKIKVITGDDGYVPPRTVEQTRKLVEQDGVLFMADSVGTPTQLAVRQYLNDRKVPQLFPATGAAPFYDPQKSPWTIGFAPSSYTEGRLIGKNVSATMPGAKVAVLFQNDDLGKDFLRGAKETLSNGATIVAQQSYEVSDPTIDSQIVSLQASNADVLFAFATQKAAAQAIRHAAEIGWKPKIFIPSIVSSISQVLQPAGLDNSKGVYTATYVKDPTSPTWENDPDVQAFIAWVKKYDTAVDVRDSFAASGGYMVGILIEKILKAAGNDLSRENIMKQATNLHDVTLPMLLPGITINTSPTDYRSIKQMQFQYFDGKNWVLTGSVVSG